MGLLDGAQLADQRVVLGVGDLGVVELVIAEVVVLDLLAQVGRADRGIAGGHGERTYRRGVTTGGLSGADCQPPAGGLVANAFTKLGSQRERSFGLTRAVAGQTARRRDQRPFP